MFVVAILGGGLSCDEPRTTVVVQQGDPQQIVVLGNGTLDGLVVRGPIKKCEGNGTWDQGVAPMPFMEVYWEVAPTAIDGFEIHRLAELGPIIYGKVPNGFKQFTPKDGQPSPICEGGPYDVQVFIRNGSDIGTSFIVREGKIETPPRGAD
jgi:hypothetical protein